MKACDKCGVALTPALGGDPQRMMVVFASQHVTTVDLCRGCYENAVPAVLDAVMRATPDYKRVA